MNVLRCTLPFALVLAIAGCGDSSVVDEEPIVDGDAGIDATAADDGFAVDAGGDLDAGGDSGTDAGSDPGADQGGDADGDAEMDGGGDPEVDAGGDPEMDAGDPDDGGVSDAGDPGDGISDAGDPGVEDGSDPGIDGGGDPDFDAGDTGGDGAAQEIWVEIDYSSAYSPQSPDWSFSDTPGWGPAQWAMPGDSWPEAWDRWNNMSVVSDPIGTVLEIGSGSELQLMIGLEELISYDATRVRLEGRSRATASWVYFDVYNPWNNCGTDGHMSQDWTIHVVELDLDQCMVPGQGVQAVRVDPTQGTLALVRMRVTITNPLW
jgi:hypothetical protein